MKTEAEVIKKTKEIVHNFQHGVLEVGNRGYKFRYFDIINIGYLYLHGVTGANPDLLDPQSKNTFIPDFIGDLNKFCEQTRIDYKELGFSVESNSPVAEYIVKAANRKVLTGDSDWTEIMERVTDDAGWYGSGYKKVYEVKGVQKHVHLNPWEMIWDLHNFAKSEKVEQIDRTIKDIVNDEKYNKEYRKQLEEGHRDELDTYMTIYQVVTDDKLYIVDILNEHVFYEIDRPESLHYVKYDTEVRRGFPDAPGRGMFEKIINVIIQNKVARERLEDVQDITSKLIYGKVADNENDKVVNKQLQALETGMILPIASPDNMIQPVNMGGGQQIVELTNKIQESRELVTKIFGTTEVLQGDAKELGANMSGIAIQSLAEYASSVLKDVKKRYARKIEWEYKTYTSSYILKVLDSKENISKYLTATELNVLRRNIIEYQLAMKEIDAEIAGEEFDRTTEEAVLKQKAKDGELIAGDILDELRGNVQGITIVVSGEKASRQIRAEFISEIKNDYVANPQIIQDAAYLGIIKKKAKIYGIDELEISEFISNLK